MGPALAILGSLVAGNLLGSISFAVLIARARGVDIFKLGSGNPGATNILRNLGKKAGYTCFLLDAFKGIAAALLGLALARLASEATGEAVNAELCAILGLAAAIVGHSFSLFLGFRGGKGVATTVGGLLVILPWVMLIGIALWLVVFFATRYVSLASLTLGLSLPVAAFFLPSVSPLGLGLCIVLALLIVVRHRANIQRLWKGTEHRSGGRASS
ncbi:MAG: glycerol-3-phosphate 1-O-acyltransferase PlsY [Verrucomicrobiota bacterium]